MFTFKTIKKMIKIKYWYSHQVVKKTHYKTGNFKSFIGFKMFFKNKFEKKGYNLQGFEQVCSSQLELFKN